MCTDMTQPRDDKDGGGTRSPNATAATGDHTKHRNLKLTTPLDFFEDGGYCATIPIEGSRGNELFRNKKLLVGLQEMWPGSKRCRFCLSTTELAACPWGPGGDYAVCATCREKS